MNPYGTSLIDLSDPAKPVILPARSSQPGVNLCFAVTRFDGQYQLTASIMHPHISRIGAKSILAGNSISVYTGVHLPLPDTVQSEEDKNLFLASEEAETLVEAAVQEVNTHRYPQKSGFLDVPAQAEYLTLNPYLAQGEVVDLKRYALAMMERPILSARSWQGKLIPLWPGIYRVIAPHLPEGRDSTCSTRRRIGRKSPMSSMTSMPGAAAHPTSPIRMSEMTRSIKLTWKPWRPTPSSIRMSLLLRASSTFSATLSSPMKGFCDNFVETNRKICMLRLQYRTDNGIMTTK